MDKYSTDRFNNASHNYEASTTTPEHNPDKMFSLDLSLATQIRLAREYKNLSHEDLAGLVGVSEQAVKNWEKEEDGQRSTPRKKHWDRLEDILDTTLYMSQCPRGNAATNPAIAEILSVAQMIAAMPRDRRHAYITLIKASTPGNDLLKEGNQQPPNTRQI